MPPGRGSPRGHAKSTTLTFKGSIHAILYQYKHYPIILSDSSDQAEGFLENIRVEFEENGLIREDFGNLQGKVWRNNVILTTTNIKVEAIGSGKKIRGRKHRTGGRTCWCWMISRMMRTSDRGAAFQAVKLV